MRKIFKGLAAALALTSVMAASAPAEARHDDDRYGYRSDHRGWDGGRHWRGDRYDRYDRGYRGYYGSRGYYDYPRRYYYAPRYSYGYGYYGYPRYRYYSHDNDALIAGIAGLAIGAAIASGSDY